MDLGFFLGNPAAVAEFFRAVVYGTPWGIIALFFFALVANASLFLPILVEPVVLVVAAFAPNPFIVLLIGVVTGVAAAIGEMTGYILGLFGVSTLKKMKEKRVKRIFEIGERLANKGMPIIFVGAFTPFPFDLIGIAAGIIKYNPKKFFVAALGGKVVRYTLIAFVGYWGMESLPWLAGVLGI